MALPYRRCAANPFQPKRPTRPPIVCRYMNPTDQTLAVTEIGLAIAIRRVRVVGFAGSMPVRSLPPRG